MCNKLVGSGIFGYDGTLPCEEVRHEPSLKFLIFRTERTVDCAAYIREIIPCVNAVAPIVQTEVVIESVKVAVILLVHIIYEFLLRIFAACVIRFCFVVKLEADDVLIRGDFFHKASDDDFRMF